MTKTKIEWADYTLNPIKGYCPNNCPYCYSHRMYKRFGWDRTIRFDEKELISILSVKKPSRVFVCSMIEMYHPDIPPQYVARVINASNYYADHNTYITLTKFPENLKYYDFPENWWVGTTVESAKYYDRIEVLKQSNSTIKFVSFEPLLTSMNGAPLYGLDWIIVGGLTPKSIHMNDWIDTIVARADELGIPVFIKNNAHYPIKREEFPASGKRAGYHIGPSSFPPFSARA